MEVRRVQGDPLPGVVRYVAADMALLWSGEQPGPPTCGFLGFSTLAVDCSSVDGVLMGMAGYCPKPSWRKYHYTAPAFLRGRLAIPNPTDLALGETCTIVPWEVQPLWSPSCNLLRIGPPGDIAVEFLQGVALGCDVDQAGRLTAVSLYVSVREKTWNGRSRTTAQHFLRSLW